MVVIDLPQQLLQKLAWRFVVGMGIDHFIQTLFDGRLVNDLPIAKCLQCVVFHLQLDFIHGADETPIRSFQKKNALILHVEGFSVNWNGLHQ